MIGFFPSPYPDELLYSICARYGEAVGYPGRIRVVKELFGGPNAAIIDLPKRLNHLLAVLPRSSYDLESLLAKRTLFRFYAHFSPLERIPLLLEVMAGSDGTSPRIRIGVTKWGFDPPSRLRFCPECAATDRKEFGQTYWHRMHQLSAIDVCAIHARFLETADLSKEGGVNNNRFISADPYVGECEPKSLSPADSLLVRLAADARWLLEYDGPLLGMATLRERYHNLLLQQGYAYYNGGIKATLLLKAFKSFYSDTFLSSINCRLVESPFNWLFNIMRHSGPGIQHPIRHLLLINFLGLTIEQVFTQFKEHRPFGSGPWPCHNKASDHFGELVAKCQVLDHPQLPGVALGIFTCSCGFSHSRLGTDPDGDKHYSILTYGSLWEKRLADLWADPALPLRLAALELGVGQLSVLRHAIRLKLPMNEPGARSVRAKSVNRFTLKNRPQRDESHLIHRSDWLAIRRKYPGAGRKELIARGNSVYLWLRRFDDVWIEANLPPVRHCSGRPRGVQLVDWNANDLQFSSDIDSAIRRIREAGPRPVRVSIAAIMREVGHRGWIESALSKLPITARILSDNLESYESFQIRKLKWAAGIFREKEIRPTKYGLVCAAQIRNKSGRTPRVQKVLGELLVELS
jgi:Tn7-like transposition protein D/TniQ